MGIQNCHEKAGNRTIINRRKRCGWNWYVKVVVKLAAGVAASAVTKK